MITIDLVTGFLGSGKTTFIRNYAEFLMKKGLRVGILENDYGAVNVDMMMLSDLIGENLEIEMIAGGCDYKTHKRRFRAKLIAMGMSGFDRVIVEPSGIFDTDEFFDVLHEDPIDRMFCPGSVIAVVDSGLSENLSAEEEYILTSQLSKAGMIVFSKPDKMKEGGKERLLTRLNEALRKYHCKRVLGEEIFIKPWEKVSEDDFYRMMQAGYQLFDHEKRFIDDFGYDSVYVMNSGIGEEKLREATAKLFSEKETFGSIMRVKGYLKTDGKWTEVNFTKEETRLFPSERGQEILIVIGRGLQKESIEKLFSE